MCETNYCDIDGNLLNGCEGKKDGDKCVKISDSTQDPSTCDAPKTSCDFGCVNLSNLHMKDCSTCADNYENADNTWDNGCEYNTSGQSEDGSCSDPKTKCSFGCVSLSDLHMKDCSTCASGYANSDNNWDNGCEAASSDPTDKTCQAPKTKCDFGCVSLSEIHMTDCNTCENGYINTDLSWTNGCETIASSEQITLGSDFFNEKCELKDLGLPVDYVLEDSLYVNCALTIEPGVTIASKSQGVNIEIHENGSIKAVGTEDKPITITSGGDAPMGKLILMSDSNTGVTNEFSYVNFQNMANSANEAISINNGIKVSMDHVTIDTVDGNGIWADEKFVKFENNTIKNCKGYPIVIDDLAVVDSLGENNTYSDNTQNQIKVNDSDIDDNPDISFKLQTIPYYFANGLYLSKDNGKYTFPAGLQLLINDNESIELFSGSLTISGTAENPVVIAPITDVNWGGMKLRSGKNTIEHLKLNKAKDGLWVSSDEVSIDNLTIDETEENGIGIDSNVKLTKFDNVNVSKTKKYPLSVSLTQLPGLGTNNTFASSEANYNYINVNDTYTSIESELSIHKQNIPYYVDDEFFLYSEKVTAVNIDAGTHLIAGRVRIHEKIKFNVNGTSDDHVVFEALPEDSWNGIYINTPNDVKLSYLDIKNVNEDNYALEISESSKKVTLDHVSLNNTDGTCLRNDSTGVTGIDTVEYSSCKNNKYIEE